MALTDKLTAIADAIRSKTGSTDPLTLDGMVTAVERIQGGGGSSGGSEVLDLIVSKRIVEANGNSTTIGDYAFYSCAELTNANFPLATSVGKYAFQDCTSLTIIDITNATSVGTNAFQNCSKLQTVECTNITSIGDYAFRSCSSLNSIDITNATSIGTYALASAKITSIKCPNLTSIGTYAFQTCLYLIDVELPLVTSIPSAVFQNCSTLTRVVIPQATSISTNAFQNCSSLVNIIIRQSNSVCTLSNTNAFTSCHHILGSVHAAWNVKGLKDGYIYVPDALVDSYKADSKWSTYATQIKPLSYYDTAVYQLTAATYNSTERPGLTLTINDDESITITNNIGAVTDAVIVNLTNPSIFATHIKSEAINNLSDELFTLTTGDIVNAEIDIIDNPNNLTVAMGWRKTGTSESFSEVSVSDTSVDKSIAVVTTADASISCGFLYIDGSFANGTSITVKPRFKVNGQRYI